MNKGANFLKLAMGASKGPKFAMFGRQKCYKFVMWVGENISNLQYVENNFFIKRQKKSQICHVTINFFKKIAMSYTSKRAIFLFKHDYKPNQESIELIKQLNRESGAESIRHGGSWGTRNAGMWSGRPWRGWHWTRRGSPLTKGITSGHEHHTSPAITPPHLVPLPLLVPSPPLQTPAPVLFLPLLRGWYIASYICWSQTFIHSFIHHKETNMC